MNRQFGNALFNKAKILVQTRRILNTPCSRMSLKEHEVVHDTKENEFYIQLEKEAEHKAVLQYSYLTENYVDLEHTVVPTQYRGRGIAKILAQAAFDHFVDRQIDMRPSCTYLQKFYKENPLPQYKDRVKWD